MFVKQQEKGLKLDHFLTSIPYIFAYVIFILEEDQYQRFVVSLAVSLICLIVVMLNNINQIYPNNSYTISVLRFLVVGILFSFSLSNSFYFIVGLLSIAFVIYKIFESLGDFVERILVEKVEMELPMALILLCLLSTLFRYITCNTLLYRNG